MTIREYLSKVDDFNARHRAAEETCRALTIERAILREQGGEFMHLKAADQELGRLSYRFTFAGEGVAETNDAGESEDAADGKRAAE